MVQYRRATKADIPAMAAMRAVEWETVDYWEKRMEGYMDGLINPQESLVPRVTIIACEGEKVVGFISGHLTKRHQCDGELEWINVIHEYRRSKVASELLQQLATWFIEMNARRICVDVDPDNDVAKIYYKRNGADYLNDHWMVWNDIGVVLNNH